MDFVSRFLISIDPPKLYYLLKWNYHFVIASSWWEGRGPGFCWMSFPILILNVFLFFSFSLYVGGDQPRITLLWISIHKKKSKQPTPDWCTFNHLYCFLSEYYWLCFIFIACLLIININSSSNACDCLSIHNYHSEIGIKIYNFFFVVFAWLFTVKSCAQPRVELFIGWWFQFIC